MALASLFAVSSDVGGIIIAPGTWPTLWLLTAQSVSRLHPHHRQARTSLVAGRASLRLTTAAVCGAIDCALRLQTIFDGCVYALSRHLHKFRCRTLSLRCQPESSACYSGPSMPCRRSPSSGRRKTPISRLLPPIEETVIATQSVGYLLYIVCDAMPTPGPDARCADALTPLRLSANHFTHSESAYGLGQGKVGLLSAVQAPQQKACRFMPPRHLPFALILV